jgi:hypothetical protein
MKHVEGGRTSTCQSLCTFAQNIPTTHTNTYTHAHTLQGIKADSAAPQKQQAITDRASGSGRGFGTEHSYNSHIHTHTLCRASKLTVLLLRSGRPSLTEPAAVAGALALNIPTTHTYTHTHTHTHAHTLCRASKQTVLLLRSGRPSLTEPAEPAAVAGASVQLPRAAVIMKA